MDRLELFRVALQLAITWVVLVVALVLARRDRLRSEAAVNELRLMLNARLDAIQQAVEEIGGTPTQGAQFVPATPDNWESMREQWAAVRRVLEGAIEVTPDLAERAELGALPRYTYEAIIDRLRTAERIDLQTSDALRAMDRRFTAVRRTRTATADQAEEFSRLYDLAVPGLRKLQ